MGEKVREGDTGGSKVGGRGCLKLGQQEEGRDEEREGREGKEEIKERKEGGRERWIHGGMDEERKEGMGEGQAGARGSLHTS